MFSLKKTMVGAIAALGMMAGSSANAAPYTALFLSIDESGSIGSSNFASQMTDYASVLGSGIIPLDGTVALGVGLFSSGNRIIHNVTAIASQADLDAVIASINAASYQGGGTNIIGAINAAAGALNGFDFGNGLVCTHNDVSCVIDVSTDGQASNPNATAAGLEPDIITNCLGIGGNADCSWVTANGFSVTANNFNELAAALRSKIIRETGGGDTVPAPAALLFLGFGLAGLGLARRKSA